MAQVSDFQPPEVSDIQPPLTDGPKRTWSWSITLSAQGLPAGELELFAVGVDTRGNTFWTPVNRHVTVVPPPPPFDTWGLVSPAAPTALCWPAGDACPSSVLLRADATGPTGVYQNPWALVRFYYRAGGAGSPTLIGETATPAGLLDDGTSRTWSWSITLSAQGLPGGELELFAVGVDTHGNTFQTPVNSNVTMLPPPAPS
jgi:hypothetical protein